MVIDQKSDQVKLGFTVKASTTVGNSTADLAKKNKGSVASITKVLSIMMVLTMPMQMMINYYHKGGSIIMMVTPMQMNYQL